MKKLQVSKSVICLALGMGLVLDVQAQANPPVAENPYTPFMLSLATPLQVPQSNYDVGGLRINLIYGECQEFDGLDINTVGRSRGHANGLQASWFANIVDKDGNGLQISAVNYVVGSYAGMQIGAVNYAGTQPKAKAQVFQFGIFNGSDYIKGFQLGVINIAREMIGVQIGIVNVIQNKDVSFLPIINCYF